MPGVFLRGQGRGCLGPFLAVMGLDTGFLSELGGLQAQMLGSFSQLRVVLDPGTFPIWGSQAPGFFRSVEGHGHIRLRSFSIGGYGP